VVETVVALLVGVVLAYTALALFAKQRTLQAALTRKAESLAALRTARHVLDAEVREGVPGRDGWSLGPDSLGLRAFRGTALVCPTPVEADEILVLVEGVRKPDPTKDSVLIFREAGPAVALALTSRAPAAGVCPGTRVGGLERWHLSGPVPPGSVLARYYERGSYHLAAGAVRYRRGTGGRQPLTPPVVDDARSGFFGWPGGVVVRLHTRTPASHLEPWPALTLRADGGSRP
jgi:hypothetical protein